MRIIALEEHFLPTDVVSRIAEDNKANSSIDLVRNLAAKYGKDLDDLGDGRIAAMDEVGIDMQVLSFVGGDVVQAIEPTRSLALSAEMNDRIAATISKYPKRFAGFASLPMSDPKAAATELTRTVNELWFVGTMVHGQTRGVFLDDPSCAPVLAAAEELQVPIYIHPGPPPKAVKDAYYMGLEPAVGNQLALGGWGWHAEVGMHVLRMVLAGCFNRFPGLQIVVGHMGEMLPFTLARANDRLAMYLKDWEKTIEEIVLGHVHITTSGYVTNPPLLCALMVFGAERIMFSVDYPFATGIDRMEATEFLHQAPISPTDREKIAHTNAERLMRLATS